MTGFFGVGGWFLGWTPPPPQGDVRHKTPVLTGAKGAGEFFASTHWKPRKSLAAGPTRGGGDWVAEKFLGG